MKAAMKELPSTKNVLAGGGDDSNKIEERSKGGGGHANNNNNHKNQQTNKDDGGGEPSVQEGSQQPSHSHEEFVNKGLQRWEEIRSQWISSGSQSSASSSVSSASSSTARQPKPKKPKRYAKDIDIDEVIDLIVSNRWRQQAPPKQSVTVGSSTSSLDTAKSATKRNDAACFAQPVSLPQMVDVLCDLWEAEGLDI